MRKKSTVQPRQEISRHEQYLLELARKKPTVNPHKEFPKYENLLHQLCHRASEMYAIPYDECLREAYEIFVICCYNFKPERGYKFITFLHFKVRWGLKRFQMKRSKDRLVFTDFTSFLHDSIHEPVTPDIARATAYVAAAPPTDSPSLDIIRELSEDAQVLTKLLVDTPKELAAMIPMTPRELLTTAKELLMEKKGWKPERVKAAHEEVQTALQLAWA